jgi:hypothetical protein
VSFLLRDDAFSDFDVYVWHAVLETVQQHRVRARTPGRAALTIRDRWPAEVLSRRVLRVTVVPAQTPLTALPEPASWAPL